MQLREKNTDLLQQKTNLYEKLSAEQDKNMKLDSKYKELLEKYDKLQSEHQKHKENVKQHADENVNYKDTLEAVQTELKIHKELNDRLTDDNKKLKIDCRIMQDRIVEEKQKVLDMMNEANQMFENVMHRSGAGTEVVTSSKLGNSVLLQPDSGFG